MGVRRAVKITYDQLAYNPPTPDSRLPTPNKVYTLGPLIHNPAVLEDLRQRGVTILDKAELFPNSQLPTPNSLLPTIIIRAHGVSPKTEAELRNRGAVVVDATCPKVKASQLKAASLAKQGYRLFLAGEDHHAEIAGIRGYAEKGWIHRDNAGQNRQFLKVVSSADEAQKAAAQLFSEDRELQIGPSKTALLAQTTISKEEYQAIGEAISKYFPALEIISTICAATKERQDSLRDLLDKVDAVVIAGGKDSANTRHLLDIAQSSGKLRALGRAAIVETADDIPADFFRFETVGLAAGASTPDTVIDAIEKRLKTVATL